MKMKPVAAVRASRNLAAFPLQALHASTLRFEAFRALRSKAAKLRMPCLILHLPNLQHNLHQVPATLAYS